MSGLEFDLVEGPAVEQLRGLGWSYLRGDIWDPIHTERASWHEVFLEDRLRAALIRLNLNDTDEPWLDHARVSQAVSALAKAGAGGFKLIEANQRATDLLLTGTTVPGLEGWDQGRDQAVRFIDWENPANNDFLAINQFRVDEASGQAKRFLTPDLVLFVNGIPLVVIECKPPGSEDAMAEAIRQLRRYANQRDDVESNEGNEQLFWTIQILIGTTFDEARFGTFTSGPEQFLEWKEAAPVSKEAVAQEVGKSVEDLASQELLIAGMLRPTHLLDIVRHFTLFMPIGRRTVKAVARHQQFRSVHRAIDRLKTGKTRVEDGDSDRRGGIIWHTQGSGKSLTMIFLVRKMRSDPELRSFKVVAVTDRTDLQKQLRDTAELSGETVQTARKTSHLRQLLSQKGPELVMAMIQKYRDETTGEAQLADDDPTETGSGLGQVNTDETILVLVDEAHRSHASTMHANLMAALPNAARIGFTGTPIIMGARKKTHDIFGPFIDTYTLTESEADESTVPIFYEGRTADAAVKGATDMDALFFRWFAGLTDEQRERLKRRYATVGQVLEAPEMIAAKAEDMLGHYVATVMPQRLKAMVVATSRLACVRYREAFRAAQAALVRALETLDPQLATMNGDEVDELDEREQFLVRARPNLELIRALDFVPVISDAHNDSADWAQWTDVLAQAAHIAAFKKPLTVESEGDTTAFVIVKSMLLTGFDAPVAQVMYLDRLIQQAELLQAIARVNRTANGKDYGLVVDYYGVTNHLAEALAVYTTDGKLDEFTSGSLRDISGEVSRLGDQHGRIRQFFATNGIELADRDDVIERCVELLEVAELRARFDIDLKKFLISLDILLPRPEARPFIADAKLLGRIQFEVRRRYRDHSDGGFNPSLYREKVRRLVDEHITVLDLAQKVPPVRITDIDFMARVSGLSSARAKASEMEHALRHHIREKLDEDPARYQKLSELLDEILNELEGKWDQLVIELEGLVGDAATSPTPDNSGLGDVERRFLGILEEEWARTVRDEGDRAQLFAVTADLVTRIRGRVAMVEFWSNPVAQDDLRRWLVVYLDDHGIYPLEQSRKVADRLVELARANHQLLVKA